MPPLAAVIVERPGVRLAIDTCLVVLLCTIGKTSVPATGVVAEVSAEILEFDTVYSYAIVNAAEVPAKTMYKPLLKNKPAGMFK